MASTEGNTINPNETAKDMTSAWAKWKAKGEEFANKANAEKDKLVQEGAENMAQQQEKATSGWGNLKGKWSEQKAKAKAKLDENKAQFEEYKASNAGKSLHERFGDGAQGLKQGAEDGMEAAKQGYVNAGQAKDVAKQEAARVHAETVSNTQSDAGDLAGAESGPPGGMEVNSPMKNEKSGAYTVGGRRRRRKSRKKKKKSKRTKRMSKKSRSSRKRRTRRRKRGGEEGATTKKGFLSGISSRFKRFSKKPKGHVLTKNDPKADILKSTEVSGTVGKVTGAYQGQLSPDKKKGFIGGKRRKSRRKKRRKSKKRKSRRSKKSRRRRRR